MAERTWLSPWIASFGTRAKTVWHRFGDAGTGAAPDAERGKERTIYIRKNNVWLRLQPSLLEEAKKAAVTEGVALNQLINVAATEKLSALRTDDFFRKRADAGKTAAVLERAGRGKPPVTGDETIED